MRASLALWDITFFKDAQAIERRGQLFFFFAEDGSQIQ